MNKRERIIVITILLIVGLSIALDILSDMNDGAEVSHLIVEGITATAALCGVFYLLIDSFRLKKKLTITQKENQELKESANVWKLEAQKFIHGLSVSIDLQLNRWNLTVSEKEVALLLLKGLSLKEVAEIRKTTEKTARVQSIAIYSKSGLSGRSELAAFFLEDLLKPQIKNGEAAVKRNS